jgi:guanylate kinase
MGKCDVFVLSAPSGTGKSTFIERLLLDVDRLAFSVSTTTRPPRDGEVDGQDYFFVDNPTFDKMVAEDGFVEWVQVYEHRYGTGKAFIQDRLSGGFDVLLDLETAGAQRVKELFPKAILIFLMPPSVRALADRLKGRGKDGDDQVSIRLSHAKHEMERWNNYDYLVLNDDLESAYQRFKAIILSARAAKVRMSEEVEGIIGEWG